MGASDPNTDGRDDVEWVTFMPFLQCGKLELVLVLLGRKIPKQLSSLQKVILILGYCTVLLGVAKLNLCGFCAIHEYHHKPTVEER